MTCITMVASFIFPCLLQSVSTNTTRVILLKSKSDHATSWLRTFQWFPTSFRLRNTTLKTVCTGSFPNFAISCPLFSSTLCFISYCSFLHVSQGVRHPFSWWSLDQEHSSFRCSLSCLLQTWTHTSVFFSMWLSLTTSITTTPPHSWNFTLSALFS